MRGGGSRGGVDEGDSMGTFRCCVTMELFGRVQGVIWEGLLYGVLLESREQKLGS